MLNSPSRRRHDHERSQDEGPSIRVLLVDDDENFRLWMTHLMRRIGFTVETAPDGAVALDMLRAEAFDLLVADYEMPRVNGFDLIRAIRRDPLLSHQYAVMLTSHDDVESKVTALTIGYDDFLTKGCTEVEVIAKVMAAQRVVSRQHNLAAAAREWQMLATQDELTGVATRRSLFAEAERLLGEKQAVGLVILDLDDFKPVNDNYGHPAGDRILRDIGALFLGRTRANDLIARYGGDEFLLLAVSLTVDELTGAAARLAAEVESLQWTIGENTFGVKTTTGVAHSSLIPNATLEQLLDVADRDLYAKKWLKKHPGQRLELYEYPGRSTGGKIVPITTPEAPPEPTRESTKDW